MENKGLKSVLLLSFIACFAFLFVSIGNPVKGKVFYLEVFGKEASTIEFKTDGTYEVSTVLGIAETGHWTFKDNVVTINPEKKNEIQYRWDADAKTLTELDTVLPKVWKLKEKS